MRASGTRTPSERFAVEVTDLSLYQTVSVHDGVATRTPRIVGKGTIRKDSLRLAGWDDRCKSLPITIKPAIPQEDGQGNKPFSAVAAFTPGDWELKSEDSWFLECWIPEEDMDRLLVAYRSGEVPSFHVGSKLDLWISKGDEYKPPGYGVTWYLVPSQRRASEFPDAAYGSIVVLSWGDAPRPKVDEDDWSPDPAPAPPVPAEPTTVAESANLAAAAAAVERLRATVMQVGIAIVFALAVSWFV